MHTLFFFIWGMGRMEVAGNGGVILRNGKNASYPLILHTLATALRQSKFNHRVSTIRLVCACVSSVVRYTMVQLYRTNRNILLLYIWFHHSVGRCHFILPLLQAVLSMPLVIIRHVTTFRISMHKCSKKNTSNHKNVIEYIFHTYMVPIGMEQQQQHRRHQQQHHCQQMAAEHYWMRAAVWERRA